jgi:hypothetical protein
MSEPSPIPVPKRWSLFLEYLRAVRRRWVSLMTGSLVVALYAILVVAFPSKEHWWNQMPQWVVWSLVVLALVAAQYRAWLDMREQRDKVLEQRRGYESAVLTVNAFTDTLSQSWGPRLPVERVQMGLLGRRFAILRVTNEGYKNLPGVVASCQFADGSGTCVWSQETGEQFVAGGNNTADLNVGATRLLVVAQGFGAESLWARLPTATQPLRVPHLIRERSGGVNCVDRTGGRVLNIGADVPVSVRMKGVGVDQTKHFRLWFNQGGPAIDAALEPPPASPLSPTASE